MVNLRHLRAYQVVGIFDSLEEARKYIKSKGYELRSYKTWDPLLQEVALDRAKDFAAKNVQLGKNVHPYSGTIIPVVKDLPMTKRTKLNEKIRDALDDVEDTGYKPRFIQILLNNAFHDKGNIDGKILTSKDKGNIVKLLRHNSLQCQFVKSSKGAEAYKNKIKKLIRREFNLQPGRRKDITKLKDMIDQLKFTEYIIDKSNIDGDLVYTINGPILDYTQYVVTTCSEEPKINLLIDKVGNPINCFIACVMDQNATYLGTRRRNDLLKRNKPNYTFEDIESVSKDFGLYVKIFDCGADKWKVYDYKSRNDNGKSRYRNNKNIYLIVHNGHATCLKEKYRLSDAHSNKELESLTLSYIETHITPISTCSEDYFKLGATCKTDYICNAVVRVRIILPHIQCTINYTEISDNYVIYIDEDLKPYLEFLVSDGIIPVVMGDIKGILCLSIYINNHKLQLRSTKSKHILEDYVPHTHNHTFGSSVMYLFRSRLESSILKISDPIIAKIMKHLCRPTIYMNVVDIPSSAGKRIYVIDLQRAYRNNCSSLGAFRDHQPVFCMNSSYETPINKHNIKDLKDGVYELYSRRKNKTWITKDELVYRFKRGENIRYRYYILYTDRTNILEEFADYIDDDNSLFGEIDDSSCRKNAFNILVGKLNPNIDAAKGYAIFKNRIDLDRFLLKGDKKIFSITPICDSWIVEYLYDNDETYRLGTNASYLSAQIINRCKLTVRKMSDCLESDGCSIIGSMTDSIIFASPSDYNVAEVIGCGKWTIEAMGDSIISRGVGQYRICMRDNIIYDRHQGFSISLTDDKFLELMVKLARRVGKETFNSIDIYKWVSQLPNHKLIIGKAGYGKSTYIRQNYSKSEWIRCAYTKLAATEIGGYSICALFGLGPTGTNSVETALGKISSYTKILLIRACGLVIDEYYTIPVGVVDTVNEILKFVRGSSLPFGGMDIIMCGDDRQTAAVGDSFVGSSLYKDMVKRGLERIILGPHDNMRLTYSYDAFCSKFRDPKMDTCSILNLIAHTKFAQSELNHGYTVYYTNSDVNARNIMELEKYKTTYPIGSTVLINDASYIVDTPAVIDDKEYCTGCPIMILTNEVSGFYNGSLAVFGGVNRNDDGSISSVIICGNGIVVTTSIEKVRITHAFAMTIHKAQCKTFPGINIYIRRTQINDSSPNSRDTLMRLLYTAMTRVRDFSDCYICLI